MIFTRKQVDDQRIGTLEHPWQGLTESEQTCIILIFEKGVTCSHLLMQPLAATCRSHLPCNHLRIGSLGKWLQQVAAESGCSNWLLGQVAASGCQLLLGQVAASGCQAAASGCRWLEVAGKWSCEASGHLQPIATAATCNHLRLVATCSHVRS